MSDHDPLCRYPTFPMTGPDACDCDLISKVRATRRPTLVDRQILRNAARWADLRAKVEALRDVAVFGSEWVDARPSDDDEWGDKPAVLRADVLALIDGGGDD